LFRIPLSLPSVIAQMFHRNFLQLPLLFMRYQCRSGHNIVTIAKNVGTDNRLFAYNSFGGKVTSFYLWGNLCNNDPATTLGIPNDAACRLVLYCSFFCCFLSLSHILFIMKENNLYLFHLTEYPRACLGSFLLR